MSNTDQTPAQPTPQYQQPQYQQPQYQQQAYAQQPQYAPAPRPIAPPYAELSFDDQRTASAFIHLISFLGGVAGAWFSYLVLRTRGGLVRQHAAAAFNFQVSFTLYAMVCGLFAIIPILGILFGLAGIAITVLRIIYFILPAKQAYRGELARIPLSIKFVR